VISPTAAANAVEPSTPAPGIVCKRWHTLEALAISASWVSTNRLHRIKVKKPQGQPEFAKICQQRYHSLMTTMNISLPDSLKDFVDEQVNQRGYGTSSEYVRELIRKEQDRLQLRSLLLAGASSAPTKPVDDAYFEGLRRRVRATKSGARR